MNAFADEIYPGNIAIQRSESVGRLEILCHDDSHEDVVLLEVLKKLLLLFARRHFVAPNLAFCQSKYEKCCWLPRRRTLRTQNNDL
jgi:hypothetical protein